MQAFAQLRMAIADPTFLNIMGDPQVGSHPEEYAAPELGALDAATSFENAGTG